MDPLKRSTTSHQLSARTLALYLSLKKKVILKRRKKGTEWTPQRKGEKDYFTFEKGY